MKYTGPTVHQSEQCTIVSRVFGRVGDKWSLLVVMTLADGSMRFSELKRAITGISQRMLTLTLRGLERDGLVSRTVTPVIPPRVDYELTPLGHSLRKPVEELHAWAFAHHLEMDKAQQAYDTRNGEAA